MTRTVILHKWEIQNSFNKLDKLYILNKVPKSLWECNIQFQNLIQMLKNIMKDIESNTEHEWEYCYHLNNVNIRVDSLRNRLSHIPSVTVDFSSKLKDVNGDTRSFKHMEFDSDNWGTKMPLPQQRLSTPSNTSSSLIELLNELTKA